MEFIDAETIVIKSPKGEPLKFVEVSCTNCGCRNVTAWVGKKHLLIWCGECEHKSILEYQCFGKIGEME